MTIDDISDNALRLWQIMNDEAIWGYTMLRQKSNLTDKELCMALGWLAREETLEIIHDEDAQDDSYRLHHGWGLENF